MIMMVKKTFSIKNDKNLTENLIEKNKEDKKDSKNIFN